MSSVPGVALLDVNVLVALFHPDHVHHDLAHDWFVGHRHAGWATCPVTENGFLRVTVQLAAEEPARADVVVELFQQFSPVAIIISGPHKRRGRRKAR